MSSKVRKLYYDQCHGTTCFPRVVIGTPSSWNTVISFSGKDDYESCTWSPCGQFIAAQVGEVIEIRNQLTFELHTVLQSIKCTHLSIGPHAYLPNRQTLAYSPDGRTLACSLSAALIFWDVQTGGMVKEIECCSNVFSLVWSLDGRRIATLSNEGSIMHVRVYDVASRNQMFAKEFNSKNDFYLWACKETFQFMEIVLHPSDSALKISISEIGIGPTFIEIQSLSIKHELWLDKPITFSPSTHHMSTSSFNSLHILNIQNSDCLLTEEGYFHSPQFSPDGSFFAASHSGGIRVWKFTSDPDRYTLWAESLFYYLPLFFLNSISLHFSPNSSSILFQHKGDLQVWNLHIIPTTPKRHHQYMAISHSGSCIATAYQSESTVSIINLHSHSSSQFIETGVNIEGLAISGNVLLVASLGKVVAWLLTEGGMVVGMFDNDMADQSNSIWTTYSPRNYEIQDFMIEGQVGVIRAGGVPYFVYHTETGGILDHKPSQFSSSYPWHCISNRTDGQEYHYLRYHGLMDDTSPEDYWPISSITTQKAEWVVDPKGRHRFWIPVNWRWYWNNKNWHHDIKTIFSNIGGKPVIIKF